MDWEKVTTELDKKLDPAHVIKPSGRFAPKGDYIEGWHAIAEANRIFGYDGWSYTIGLVKDDIREATKDGKTQWQAAYSCVCTVTVGTTVRQDVGFGSGFAARIGDAIEGATKEAVTDALKRALRTFGNQFGLALYDKKRENVGHDEPEFDARAAKDRISKAMDGCETYQQLSELWAKESATVMLIGKAERALGVQLYEKRNQLKKSFTVEPPPPPVEYAADNGLDIDDEIPF